MDMNLMQIYEDTIKPFPQSKMKEPVYHGSRTKFTRFDPKFINTDGMYGGGFYFTDNIEYSKDFGQNVYRCYVNIRNPFDIPEMRWKLFVPLLDRITDNEDRERMESFLRMAAYTTAFRLLRKYVDIQDLGYDSIIGWADHPGGGKEYIVFKPNQVRIIS